MGSILIFACLATIFAILMSNFSAGRPRNGLQLAYVSALFILPMLAISITSGVSLDLRFIAAVGALLCVAGSSEPGPPFRLNILDLLMSLLTVCAVLSSITGNSFSWSSIVTMFFDVLPYIMGRRLLGSTSDLQRVTTVAIRGCIFLTLMGIFEMLSHRNLLAKVTGSFNFMLENGEGYRWGMQRARTIYSHPIAFGMCSLLLLPWTTYALALSRRKLAPRWWRFLPTINAACVISALSRGPMIMMIIGLYFAALLRMPKVRMPMLGLAAVTGMILFGAQDEVLRLLGSTVGQESEVGSMIIMIDRHPEVYNGTKHRKLLYLAYKQPMADAGYLGFGPEGIMTVPTTYRINKLLWSIDNAYIIQHLSYGALGIWLFDATLGCALLYAIILAWRGAGGPYQVFAAGLAGSLLAVTVGMFSVYMASDYRAPLFFTMGVSGCIWSLRPNSSANPAPLSPRR